MNRRELLKSAVAGLLGSAVPAGLLVGPSSPNVVWLPIGPTFDEFAFRMALYRHRLLEYAWISPSDLRRVSGDPRSGYAVEIITAGTLR